MCLAAACGEPELPLPPPPPPILEDTTLLDLIVAADRRSLDATFQRAASASEPATRRAAHRALARLHDPEALPLLQIGLRDTDSRVRAAAAFGIGALGEDGAPSAGALAGAMAVEPELEVRARMIRSLGRLGSDEALAALLPALRDERAPLRAAACFGVAERALAGGSVSREIRARLASRLDGNQPEDVRFACAFALSRLPALQGNELRGEVVQLQLALGDESARVRLFAYRALGRIESASLESVAHGIEDRDWRVRVQAVGSLGRLATRGDEGPEAMAEALRISYAALLQDGAISAGPPLHVFLAATSAAGPLARTEPVHALAARLHRQLARRPASRDQAIAHCAAAALVDRGRGWPTQVADCGGEEITDVERAVREAQVLGSLDGAPPQRIARLRRLLDREEPVVREAALAAAAQIIHPDANRLVLEALSIDDAGVRPAALDALRTIASRRPSADMVPPPLAPVATLAALRAARESTPADELETLVTWLEAVDATDARELVPSIRELSGHPNRGVRDRARGLLEKWEAEPAGESGPIANAIAEDAIPSPGARPRVRLETARGPITIELAPDEAPATVARFLSLVESGFYDGLVFHRVVPGFVVQGGDPRGDGYGGPGWSQRCEDNPLPYVRGTVGMALAGRDTGGSQFFITHGAQPHLEGRYTAFGRVVVGMDHVDQIQAGDTLREAILLTEEPSETQN